MHAGRGLSQRSFRSLQCRTNSARFRLDVYQRGPKSGELKLFALGSRLDEGVVTHSGWLAEEVGFSVTLTVIASSSDSMALQLATTKLVHSVFDPEAQVR